LLGISYQLIAIRPASVSKSSHAMCEFLHVKSAVGKEKPGNHRQGVASTEPRTFGFVVALATQLVIRPVCSSSCFNQLVRNSAAIKRVGVPMISIQLIFIAGVSGRPNTHAVYARPAAA